MRSKRTGLVKDVVLAMILALVVLGLGSGPAQAQARSDDSAVSARVESDDVSEDGSMVPEDQSFLAWALERSGLIGVVILLMSLYLIALVAWMAFHYRRAEVVPAGLVRDVEALLQQKRFSEAYDRLETSNSMLARVLAAGVRKLPKGLPNAKQAMEVVNEDATMEMEHRATYLATAGTLGPMIGLLGTVYGMILSFQVMSVESTTPNASQLAGGISTALFATLEGIGLSIPAIAFYALFRNRIARLSMDVLITADPLLEQFAPGVRAQTPLNMLPSSVGPWESGGSSSGPPPSSTPPSP